MKQTNTNETTANNSKSLKNKLIIPLLLLSLALIFSFGVSAVSAVVTDTSSGSSVIYVNDSGGSDSNNGTSWEWAKKSISNATGNVAENGTVYIADGTYTGENNTGITIGKNMNIIGQSQTGTIINGTDTAQIFQILSGISVTIQNLTITNGNNAYDVGGAIYNAGNLTISGCTFTDNAADYGGAIYNDGSLTVSGSTFTGNTAQWYGGAINNGGNLTVSDSTFTDNTAQDESWSVGGAIYNYGSLIISGSNFTNNIAANGGAINNQGNGLTVSGSTFTGNTAIQGGAIYNYYDNLNVTNCTFTGNIALMGGAIYNNGDTSTPVTISGSTFDSNTATNGNGGAINNEGSLTVTNSNFIGNTAPSTVTNEGNGGAIENSENLTIIDSTFTDNTARWAGGAIESSGTLTVTGSTFTDNTASHGGAIHNYQGILNIASTTFTGNTVIYNGGAIHNQGTLNVTGSSFTGNNATNGGAIYHYQGAMTLYDCNFTSNNAYAPSRGHGGAIYNNAGSTITGTNFIGNSANGFGGAIVGDGSITMTNGTFTGNNAGLDGGAIYSYYGTLNITDSNFLNNIAHGLGGAIVSCTVLNLYGSTLTGNHAVGYTTGTTYGWGGAIYIQRGNAQIHYNRIAGNSAVVSNALYFDTVLGGSVNATNNWWGSNDNPSNQIHGPVNYSPWLYMTINATPTTINNTQTSLITVSFNNRYDGTTVTPYTPGVGEYIPDGSPVNFQTDLGTIGCKSIDKTTVGGIATAILTATELAGTAHVNATTDNQTIFVNVTITPKSSLYLTVAPSKTNPAPGDTVIYTLKVGNNGPDTAKDVVMTYKIPEGLEFGGATVDMGTYSYDPATRTITWNISDVPKGDPYMWLSLRIAQPGQYLINPTLRTSTFDPTLNSSIQAITVNAAAQTNTTVNAASRTVGMQDTGLPLAGLVLAVLLLSAGLIMPKRK